MDIQKFLKDQVAELHNVTWPTKKQAIHIMITVISIMLIVGVFLTILDNGITEMVSRMLKK